MYYAFDSFLPDIDPSSPNILTECENLVPHLKGYTAVNSLSPLPGMQALSSTAVGIFFAHRVDDVTYVIAGTPDRLWRKQANSWTAVSSTLGPVSKWRFAQQGNIVFAVNKSTPSLACDTLTFSAIATMPKANIIDTVGQFVMLADIVDPVHGDVPDGWKCCALGDFTDWTEDIATQCAFGRLLDTPGPLTAGKKLQDNFVFYKRKGFWLAKYAGPPFIWDISYLVSREIGALSQESVINIDDRHLFIGENNFYSFDGSPPKPIGTGIREWFFSDVSKQYFGNIQGCYDDYNKLAFWFYPSGDSAGTPNKFVCYNIESEKWGAGAMSVYAAGDYIQDALTWDELWAGLTWDEIPNTTWDEISFRNSAIVPLFINTSGQLCMMTGSPLSTRLKTGFIGDDAAYTKVTRVRPRFSIQPTEALMTPSRALNLGVQPTSGYQRLMVQGMFSLTQAGRWHQFEMITSGTAIAQGLNIDFVAAGRK